MFSTFQAQPSKIIHLTPYPDKHLWCTVLVEALHVVWLGPVDVVNIGDLKTHNVRCNWARQSKPEFDPKQITLVIVQAYCESYVSYGHNRAFAVYSLLIDNGLFSVMMKLSLNCHLGITEDHWSTWVILLPITSPEPRLPCGLLWTQYLVQRNMPAGKV